MNGLSNLDEAHKK